MSERKKYSVYEIDRMRMLVRELHPFCEKVELEAVLRTYMENGTDVADLETVVREIKERTA